MAFGLKPSTLGLQTRVGRGGGSSQLRLQPACPLVLSGFEACRPSAIGILFSARAGLFDSFGLLFTQRGDVRVELGLKLHADGI